MWVCHVAGQHMRRVSDCMTCSSRRREPCLQLGKPLPGCGAGRRRWDCRSFKSWPKLA